VIELQFINTKSELASTPTNEDKHHDGWRKLIRFAKDSYRMLKHLDPNNEVVIKVRQKLIQIPAFVLQVASK